MPFTLREDALTTLEMVKTFIGISESTYDQALTDTINAVTAFFERECDRRFAENTYTNELYDSEFEPWESGLQMNLYVKQYPVSDFTTIEYRNGDNAFFEYQETDYLLYEEEGRIYFYGGVPRGRQSVRVTYTAGYVIDWEDQAAHTLPMDLTYAVTHMVAKIFNTRKTLGIKSESIGSWSITYMDIAAAKDEVAKDAILKYSRSLV